MNTIKLWTLATHETDAYPFFALRHQDLLLMVKYDLDWEIEYFGISPEEVYERPENTPVEREFTTYLTNASRCFDSFGTINLDDWLSDITMAPGTRIVGILEHNKEKQLAAWIAQDGSHVFCTPIEHSYDECGSNPNDYRMRW